MLFFGIDNKYHKDTVHLSSSLNNSGIQKATLQNRLIFDPQNPTRTPPTLTKENLLNLKVITLYPQS